MKEQRQPLHAPILAIPPILAIISGLHLLAAFAIVANMLTSFANRAHAAYPLPCVFNGRGIAMNA